MPSDENIKSKNLIDDLLNSYFFLFNIKLFSFMIWKVALKAQT